MFNVILLVVFMLRARDNQKHAARLAAIPNSYSEVKISYFG